LIERTQQKLRFARLHLDELSKTPSRHGNDFERAHQEAFLAQLFGAYNAFLVELNSYLNCGLVENDITLGNMRNVLKKRGRQSSTLKVLYELSRDEASWFKQAKDMRDYSTHVSGIPLCFYAGGVDDGKLALKHPRTKKELPDDFINTFNTWLFEMEQLTEQQRAAAIKEA
jgi:hypothetical protein